jgi:hypothetical protein
MASANQDDEFNPYSSIKPFLGEPPRWFPEDVRERVASYIKYDELYWNDDTQFELRVLEGEAPLYIPNARTIVDTTSHFLLKGLTVTTPEPEKNKEVELALNQFLDREEFYNKFHVAKHSGCSRGDFVLHLTADPMKAEGTRVSINSVHPGIVVPIYENEDPDRLIRVHLVSMIPDPRDASKNASKNVIHKLTYEYEGEGEARKVMREEGLFELDPEWYGPVPKQFQAIIARSPLPDPIRTIPVYWFKNIDWQSQLYGSSELRGFVRLLQGVSQSATDEGTGLALEGLGVYATDSGRPVNDAGKEIDWVIQPARVMEVVSGAYFRRVEGLSTLKPFMDHIGYMESKAFQGSALTDVALGQVDVQTAQSGIALAIKFMPTMAKIEERDTAGVAKVKQLFHDWKAWMAAYETTHIDEELEFEVVLGDKLPGNNVEKVNELNNMYDRKIISKKYYRSQMHKLGYEFPDNIDAEIEEEQKKDAELAALAAPPALQGNAQAAVNGQKPPPPNSAGGRQNDPRNQGPSRSNNRNRVNESAGTEAR